MIDFIATIFGMVIMAGAMIVLTAMFCAVFAINKEMEENGVDTRGQGKD